MTQPIGNGLQSNGNVSTAPSEKVESKTTTLPAEAKSKVAGDTVKLSQTAQIHALKQQGQSAANIAASLGVSVVSVDTTLGVALPKAVAAAVTSAPAATVKSEG